MNEQRILKRNNIIKGGSSLSLKQCYEVYSTSTALNGLNLYFISVGSDFELFCRRERRIGSELSLEVPPIIFIAGRLTY